MSVRFRSPPNAHAPRNTPKAFCTGNFCARTKATRGVGPRLQKSGVRTRMSKGKSRATLIGAALAALALAGCGDKESVERGTVNYESYTAQQIFERGEYDLAQNDPALAAKSFAEVERLYPYSDLAKRAVIMQAFAYHRDKDYEQSRAAAQRFIDFYPTDEDAAYAQYLLALSYYDQIDEVGRDQGLTFQALQSLREVIERYPDSEYASSAILKFDLENRRAGVFAVRVTLDHLAQGLQGLECQPLIAADLIDLVVVAQRQQVLRIGCIAIGGIEIDEPLRGGPAVLVILGPVIGKGLHDHRALGPFGIRIKAFDLGKDIGGQFGITAGQIVFGATVDLFCGEVFVLDLAALDLGVKPAATGQDRPHEKRRQKTRPDLAACHARTHPRCNPPGASPLLRTGPST